MGIMFSVRLRWPPMIPPAPVPPRGRLRWRDRAHLAAEILSLYVPSLLALRRQKPIAEHLAHARSPGGGRVIVAPEEQRVLALRLGRIVERVLERLPTDNRC